MRQLFLVLSIYLKKSQALKKAKNADNFSCLILEYLIIFSLSSCDLITKQDFPKIGLYRTVPSCKVINLILPASSLNDDWNIRISPLQLLDRRCFTLFLNAPSKKYLFRSLVSYLLGVLFLVAPKNGFIVPRSFFKSSKNADVVINIIASPHASNMSLITFVSVFKINVHPYIKPADTYWMIKAILDEWLSIGYAFLTTLLFLINNKEAPAAIIPKKYTTKR